MLGKDVLNKNVVRRYLGIGTQRERSIVANVANLSDGLHFLMGVVFMLQPTFRTAKYLPARAALNLFGDLHGLMNSINGEFYGRYAACCYAKQNELLASIVLRPCCQLAHYLF